jgi:hypothetical protein
MSFALTICKLRSVTPFGGSLSIRSAALISALMKTLQFTASSLVQEFRQTDFGNQHEIGLVKVWIKHFERRFVTVVVMHGHRIRNGEHVTGTETIPASRQQ